MPIMSADDLKKKITSQNRVIILQHTFGQVGYLDDLLAIISRHQLFLIEDCAHVMGGKWKGQTLGTLGDAAFFSFGRDKPLSSVFGGLVVVKDGSLMKNLKSLRDKFRPASFLWIMKQLMYAPIIWTVKSAHWWNIWRHLLFIYKKSGLISRPVEEKEKRGLKPDFVFRQYPEALALLALRQLAKLARFNDHRLKIAEIYSDKLKNTNIGLPRDDADTLFIPLRYVLRSANPGRIIGEAKKKDIYLGDWYNEVIAPTGVIGSCLAYIDGSCPEAEKLSKMSVNLPTDINVSVSDAARISEFIRYIK